MVFSAAGNLRFSSATVALPPAWVMNVVPGKILSTVRATSPGGIFRPELSPAPLARARVRGRRGQPPTRSSSALNAVRSGASPIAPVFGS